MTGFGAIRFKSFQVVSVRTSAPGHVWCCEHGINAAVCLSQCETIRTASLRGRSTSTGTRRVWPPRHPWGGPETETTMAEADGDQPVVSILSDVSIVVSIVVSSWKNEEEQSIKAAGFAALPLLPPADLVRSPAQDGTSSDTPVHQAGIHSFLPGVHCENVVDRRKARRCHVFRACPGGYVSTKALETSSHADIGCFWARSILHCMWKRWGLPRPQRWTSG